MKRKLLAPAVLALACSACGLGDNPPITDPIPSVAIRPTSLTVAVGATDTLLAIITGVPTSADRVPVWSIGDTTIVQVTALSPPDRVLVLGRKAGNTTVTAAWRTDRTVQATAEVTVR